MKESIAHHVLEIKNFLINRESLLAALIIVLGLGSFGLGRLSALEERKTAVKILPANAGTAFTAPVLDNSPKAESTTLDLDGGFLIGSKNGTKYHHPWCPGAQKISEENKIRFSSKEEAEKAGYTPAANCKGL